MRRRQFLATAAVVGFSGCGQLPGVGGRSRFAGESCPEIGGTPQCYHGANPATAGVFLVPEQERVDSPSAPLRFALVNRGVRPVRADVTFLTLARRVDGRWQALPHRRQDDMGMATVGSGDAHVFGLVNGSWRELEGADTTTSERYGGGEFAFAVRLLDPARNQLARVSVDGDSLTLSPPDSVETDRGGDVLTVRHPRVERDRAPLTAEFATTAPTPDAVRLAPEVLHGRWELRSVAFLRREGVETVRAATVDDFFRTPREWLSAARVPVEPGQRYSVGDLTFTLSERPE